MPVATLVNDPLNEFHGHIQLLRLARSEKLAHDAALLFLTTAAQRACTVCCFLCFLKKLAMEGKRCRKVNGDAAMRANWRDTKLKIAAKTHEREDRDEIIADI